MIEQVSSPLAASAGQSRAGDRTHYDIDTIAAHVDHRQAIALSEWSRLADGSIPQRSALRPERIVSALPVSALIGVDWDHGEPVFRPRIEGQLIIIAFGEARRRSFSEIYDSAHLAQILPVFRETALTGRMSLTPAATRTSDGEPFGYSRLLLPFADTSGRVVRILSVYGFDIDRLRGLTEPLDIGDVIPVSKLRRPGLGAYMRQRSA